MTQLQNAENEEMKPVTSRAIREKVASFLAFAIMLLGLSSAAAFAAEAATTAVVQAATGETTTLWTKVTSALVGVAGVITTAVISVVAKDMAENRLLQVITRKRRCALKGKWEGPAANIMVPEDMPADVKFTFTVQFTTVRRKIVKGTGTFKNDGKDYTITVYGGFYNDTYLKLEYWHEEEIIGFGYMILKLDDHATRLTGKAVAYGSTSSKIVVGTIDLNKL